MEDQEVALFHTTAYYHFVLEESHHHLIRQFFAKNDNCKLFFIVSDIIRKNIDFKM